MAAARGLRELALCTFGPCTLEDMAGLSRLTQLSSLTLLHEEGALKLQPSEFAATLAPLRGLRSLACDHTLRPDGSLRPLAEALPDLEELRLPNAGVCTEGLTALTALTLLEVHSFAAPRSSAANDHPQPWALPPRLRQLWVREGLKLESALALPEPHAELRTVSISRESTRVSARDGGALMRREDCANLIALAGFVEGRLEPRECHFSSYTRSPPSSPSDSRTALLPPMGAPDHRSWLSAWGRVGLTRLRLEGFAFVRSDLAAIADHMTMLQELRLDDCRLPAAALPSLARLPRLRTLTLDLLPWLRPGVAAEAAAAAQGRVQAAAAPPPLDLPSELRPALVQLCREAGDRLRAVQLGVSCVNSAAHAELQRAGVQADTDNMANQRQLHQLPAELRSAITVHLKPRDLSSLRLTCAAMCLAMDRDRPLQITEHVPVPEDAARAMLDKRGCRPQEVLIRVQMPQTAQAVLEACAAHAPLPTTKLTLLTHHLTPDVARLAARAFPHLEDFALQCIRGQHLGPEAAEGLVALLGPAQQPGPPGEAAGAPQPPAPPLLPSLRRLALGGGPGWLLGGLRSLPAAVLDALAAAPGLRELALSTSGACTPGDVARLSRLTQLQSLTLYASTGARQPDTAQLAAALAPLRRLRTLACDHSLGPDSRLQRFTEAFTALRELRLPNTCVCTEGLAALTALTLLEPRPRHLLPSPGAADHRSWLSAWGRVGLTRLRLEGFAFVKSDLDAIADHMETLEELRLDDCRLPAAALPSLARLPRLRTLTLDLLPWLRPGVATEAAAAAQGQGQAAAAQGQGLVAAAPLPLDMPPELRPALVQLCREAGDRLRAVQLGVSCLHLPELSDLQRKTFRQLASLRREVNAALSESGTTGSPVKVALL
ncbi:hypothetical protein HYH03_012433 [Edaphochlamys debaryana]|uniref:Uncharacterized protein n=1 Tax=Edaphochlamys debaryana TaxID=47281 RepID=A0A835XU05_9CHLO|nr:hypothetical protein HYH03_012433 [Edaphochlamys debaryana]|eukprot:KAG2488993.1 hypothetical protein HYH03_012433 [Edaphochlamys debaryana]